MMFILTLICYILCGIVGFYLIGIGIIATLLYSMFGNKTWEVIVGPLYAIIGISILVGMYFNWPFK